MLQELPKYKCHKEVRAAKIDSIESHDQEDDPDYGKVILHFVDCLPALVDDRFLQKHNPVVGGYFVLYEDGYESFSPAKAFEEGYTLIQEEKL